MCMQTPDPQTTKVWTSLVSVSRALQERIEDDLKAHGLPPLAWYDALFEIEKAGKHGIRPFELKERLLLPQYGISRLLDRLAERGLVTRDGVQDDGRGQVVRLTQKGRETRLAMWPVYAGVLVSAIGDRLSASEAAELARLLGRLSEDR